jgi:hypothetical protein
MPGMAFYLKIPSSDEIHIPVFYSDVHFDCILHDSLVDKKYCRIFWLSLGKFPGDRLGQFAEACISGWPEK